MRESIFDGQQNKWKIFGKRALYQKKSVQVQEMPGGLGGLDDEKEWDFEGPGIVNGSF